jgi:predicted lipase
VNPQYPGCPFCSVHRGFYYCNQNTLSQALAAVQKLFAEHPGAEFIVGGHSLGASVATLAAVSFKLAGYNPKLYAIGSPRVGNSQFSDYASGMLDVHYRMTYYKDLVPHVPPMLFFGYQHLTNEVYEDGFGNLHLCSGPEDPNCGDQWPIWDLSEELFHLTYLGHIIRDCEPVVFG